MPNAAIIAAALTDHSAHPYGLFLGGVDVLKQPGGGYGVSLDTITVDEASVTAVSAMSFTIDDPARAVTVTDAMPVSYWDLALNIPLFAGYVDRWDLSPDFGGQGQSIAVSCTGAEAILDWAVITADVTYASGMSLQSAIQSVVVAASGAGALRAFSGTAFQESNQATPIAGFTVSAPLTYAVALTAGTSLRECLRLLCVAAVVVIDTGHFSGVLIWWASVDFWHGLRVTEFPGISSSAVADDWARLDISDTYAGAQVASDLNLTTEGATVRGVFIKGLNAAGTGYLNDGTGLAGAIAYVSDPTIDTAAKLASAQTAYLAQYAQSERGSFQLVSVLSSSLNSEASQVRAGSGAHIVDASVGATGGKRRPIYEIEKTFEDGGRETWTVHFGAPKASLSRAARRLTYLTRF